MESLTWDSENPRHELCRSTWDLGSTLAFLPGWDHHPFERHPDRPPSAPRFVPAMPACADQHMKWWCLETAPPPGLPLPPRGAVTYQAAWKEDISGSASARLQAVP